MVGVAVTMVISTMYEKSCIYLHDNLKKKKFQNFVIHISRNLNDKIVKNHQNGFLKSSEPQDANYTDKNSNLKYN